MCGKEEEEDEGSSWVMIAADAILVAGACVVDESMLTGETVRDSLSLSVFIRRSVGF